MIHSVAMMIEIIAVVGACCSACYYIVCLSGIFSFLHKKKKSTGNFSPAVSILKPLKGTDPGMYESLRSHCLQNYSAPYEIIFGVDDPADPALQMVEKLKAEFPELPIKNVICPKILGSNIKVSNLEQMLPHAQHEYLIVNDSDIRAGTDYLQKVLSPFEQNKTGMVTCLYRGVPASTLGSQLEALGISTDFCPGVLTALLLEGGLHFGLGSTLAFRRRDLQAIGGFEGLVDYLADDYQLGNRIAAAGLDVELSACTVETYLPAYSLSGFFWHQLRWARTVRDSRRWGYTGLIFTWGLPWALLAVISARGTAWAWELFGAVVALRFAVAIVAGKTVLQDRNLFSQLWLLPLRDLFAPFLWCASFLGHTISWRGDVFTLKEGKLVKR